MMSEGRSRQPNSNANEQQQQEQQQQQQQQQQAQNNNNNNNNNNLPPVNFCDIMTVFEKAVQEVRCGQTAMRKNLAAVAAAAAAGGPQAGISGDRDVTYFNRTLIIILHLICLLTKLAAAHLSPEQIFNVKQGWIKWHDRSSFITVV